MESDFDARSASDLEELLQNGSFPADLLERARQLRQLVVTEGISKYEAGRAPVLEKINRGTCILVPGQVEDDRAVLEGGQGLTSNLELLRRVRAQAPNAHIVYKPHPDVEAGHRKGAISDDECLSVADEVARGAPISQLIDAADEVHVNTSLAGFETLLRQKPVTTYGVAFYAGWGLTRDLGAVPPRRSTRRSLDELVAATLILYPRYVDPLSGLPCPAETLARRLAEGYVDPGTSLLVRLRQLHGRFSGSWHGWVYDWPARLPLPSRSARAAVSAPRRRTREARFVSISNSTFRAAIDTTGPTPVTSSAVAIRIGRSSSTSSCASIGLPT